MKTHSLLTSLKIVLACGLIAHLGACTRAHAQTNTLPAVPTFTTGSNILDSIGSAPKQVLSDGYLALKDISLTNPIAFHVFGLMNGTGKYGFGLEVNEADPNKTINAGFALAAIQTDKGGSKSWNFYDATLNIGISQTETIPLLKIPITVRIFSGPFVSLNGGTLIGEQSGVSGDMNFKLSSHMGMILGGGVVNCAGAAAEGLKPAMPMAHLAIVWAPKGW
jgi:hypothetical protein